MCFHDFFSSLFFFLLDIADLTHSHSTLLPVFTLSDLLVHAAASTPFFMHTVLFQKRKVNKIFPI